MHATTYGAYFKRIAEFTKSESLRKLAQGRVFITFTTIGLTESKEFSPNRTLLEVLAVLLFQRRTRSRFWHFIAARMASSAIARDLKITTWA